jgi:hypothetical protein
MQHLPFSETSQSHLFWLEKGERWHTQPAPWPDGQQSLRAFRSAIAPGRADAPPRWHIHLTLEADGNALAVRVRGWCLLAEEAKWIRVTVNGSVREAPVWLPRADVFQAFAGTDDYARWNALCCGVDAVLAFDDTATQALAVGVEIVAMDGSVIAARLPQPVPLGEPFALLPPVPPARQDTAATGAPAVAPHGAAAVAPGDTTGDATGDAPGDAASHVMT